VELEALYLLIQLFYLLVCLSQEVIGRFRRQLLHASRGHQISSGICDVYQHN
jgi:hypothetical protein